MSGPLFPSTSNGPSGVMAIRCGFPTVAAAIEQIDDDSWVDINYPDGGAAQVAETTYTAGRHTLRLVQPV